MWPLPDRIHLILPLIFHPKVNHLRREHIPLQPHLIPQVRRVFIAPASPYRPALSRIALNIARMLSVGVFAWML